MAKKITLIEPTEQAMFCEIDTDGYRRAIIVADPLSGTEEFPVGIEGQSAVVYSPYGTPVRLNALASNAEIICGPRYTIQKPTTAEPCGVYLWVMG